MKLTPEEMLILRRDVATVDSLFRKGLLSVIGGKVVITDAGNAVLAEHKRAVSAARAKAGRVGGSARADVLTPKRKKQIASDAVRARYDRKGGTE